MLSISAIQGLPEIVAGDDLATLIGDATSAQFSVSDGAVLVVAQKIVSKAEDRLVSLRDVDPSASAIALAEQVEKDPRLVELILKESNTIVRQAPGLLIVEHRSGHILANAGIDTSNISQDAQNPQVLLWPENPDQSAAILSDQLAQYFGHAIPVIINDSIGRPWRYGTVGQAIGCAGIDPLWNQVGELDRFNNELRVTEPATADGIAAAAALVQGEAAEGLPVVWVQGCLYKPTEQGNASALLRSRDRDLFR